LLAIVTPTTQPMLPLGRRSAFGSRQGCITSCGQNVTPPSAEALSRNRNSQLINARQWLGE
jgi:hypothetical protein